VRCNASRPDGSIQPEREVLMPTKLQTLQDHCHRFENGLATAATAEEAQALRTRICRELGETCQSGVVRELLEEHSEAMIRARFAAVADVRPRD
jgi:hypothetical protein